MTEVPGYAVIGIMAPQRDVEIADLLPDRQVPHSPHLVLQ